MHSFISYQYQDELNVDWDFKLCLKFNFDLIVYSWPIHLNIFWGHIYLKPTALGPDHPVMVGEKRPAVYLLKLVYFVALKHTFSIYKLFEIFFCIK